MSVRAVAMALAAWCVSGAAMAAGYSEVWNPPEASGHAVSKPAKKKPQTVKSEAGAGVKTDAKHAARSPHQAPRVASAHVHGDKTAAHGAAKKVAVKGTKGSVRQAAVSGAGVKSKPNVAANGQVRKPHAQLVHAKPGQGSVVRADLTRPHAVGGTANSDAVKPAVPHPATPVASANFSGNTADALTNPATASSGSLPPIIH